MQVCVLLLCRGRQAPNRNPRPCWDGPPAGELSAGPLPLRPFLLSPCAPATVAPEGLPLQRVREERALRGWGEASSLLSYFITSRVENPPILT